MNTESDANESYLNSYPESPKSKDRKEGIRNIFFDHIYACHSSQVDRPGSSRIRSEIVVCHQNVEQTETAAVSMLGEVKEQKVNLLTYQPHLSESLNSCRNENKQLKNMLLMHLDLIQQQSDQLLGKEKQLASIKEENVTLKEELAKMGHDWYNSAPIYTSSQQVNTSPPVQPSQQVNFSELLLDAEEDLSQSCMSISPSDEDSSKYLNGIHLNNASMVSSHVSNKQNDDMVTGYIRNLPTTSEIDIRDLEAYIEEDSNEASSINVASTSKNVSSQTSKKQTPVIANNTQGPENLVSTRQGLTINASNKQALKNQASRGQDVVKKTAIQDMDIEASTNSPRYLYATDLTDKAMMVASYELNEPDNNMVAGYIQNIPTTSMLDMSDLKAYNENEFGQASLINVASTSKNVSSQASEKQTPVNEAFNTQGKVNFASTIQGLTTMASSKQGLKTQASHDQDMDIESSTNSPRKLDDFSVSSDESNEQNDDMVTSYIFKPPSPISMRDLQIYIPDDCNGVYSRVILMNVVSPSKNVSNQAYKKRNPVNEAFNTQGPENFVSTKQGLNIKAPKNQASDDWATHDQDVGQKTAKQDIDIEVSTNSPRKLDESNEQNKDKVTGYILNFPSRMYIIDAKAYLKDDPDEASGQTLLINVVYTNNNVSSQASYKQSPVNEAYNTQGVAKLATTRQGLTTKASNMQALKNQMLHGQDVVKKTKPNMDIKASTSKSNVNSPSNCTHTSRLHSRISTRRSSISIESPSTGEISKSPASTNRTPGRRASTRTFNSRSFTGQTSASRASASRVSAPRTSATSQNSNFGTVPLTSTNSLGSNNYLPKIHRSRSATPPNYDSDTFNDSFENQTFDHELPNSREPIMDYTYTPIYGRIETSVNNEKYCDIWTTSPGSTLPSPDPYEIPNDPGSIKVYTPIPKLTLHRNPQSGNVTIGSAALNRQNLEKTSELQLQQELEKKQFELYDESIISQNSAGKANNEIHFSHNITQAKEPRGKCDAHQSQKEVIVKRLKKKKENDFNKLAIVSTKGEVAEELLVKIPKKELDEFDKLTNISLRDDEPNTGPQVELEDFDKSSDTDEESHSFVDAEWLPDGDDTAGDDTANEEQGDSVSSNEEPPQVLWSSDLNCGNWPHSVSVMTQTDDCPQLKPLAEVFETFRTAPFLSFSSPLAAIYISSNEPVYKHEPQFIALPPHRFGGEMNFVKTQNVATSTDDLPTSTDQSKSAQRPCKSKTPDKVNTSSSSESTRLSGSKKVSEESPRTLPPMKTTEAYYTVNASWCPSSDEDIDVDKYPDPSKNLEVPRWQEKKYTSLDFLDTTENLDDAVFRKRHSKHEMAEKRRKRWDMQRIREQRQIERLLKRQNDKCVSTRPNRCRAKPLPKQVEPSRTFWPKLRDIQYIEIVDEIPVSAFGEMIPDITESDFSLPAISTDKNTRQDVANEMKNEHREQEKEVNQINMKKVNTHKLPIQHEPITALKNTDTPNKPTKKSARKRSKSNHWTRYKRNKQTLVCIDQFKDNAQMNQQPENPDVYYEYNEEYQPITSLHCHKYSEENKISEGHKISLNNNQVECHQKSGNLSPTKPLIERRTWTIEITEDNEEPQRKKPKKKNSGENNSLLPNILSEETSKKLSDSDPLVNTIPKSQQPNRPASTSEDFNQKILMHSQNEEKSSTKELVKKINVACQTTE